MNDPWDRPFAFLRKNIPTMWIRIVVMSPLMLIMAFILAPLALMSRVGEWCGRKFSNITGYYP